MRHLCAQSGYDLVPFLGEADVYVINTCTVTSEADREGRRLARQARRRAPEGARVVIAGCSAQANQHGMQIPEADLLAVQNWTSATHLSDADRAVLQATDDCLDVGFIQPNTWDSIKVHLKTPAEQIELVIAIGNWMLFAQLLRSLNVPLEDGIRSWPPTGSGPQA